MAKITFLLIPTEEKPPFGWTPWSGDTTYVDSMMVDSTYLRQKLVNIDGMAYELTPYKDEQELRASVAAGEVKPFFNMRYDDLMAQIDKAESDELKAQQ